MLPDGRQLWLTSFWGFEPQLWGGAGFTQEHDRAHFLNEAGEGAILAIYITRQKGPENQRGKLVGFMEMTTQTGPMQSFTSPTEWAAADRDAGTKGKWIFGVRASRAWEVIEEHWSDVDAVFPETYATNNKQQIGSRSVRVSEAEQSNILDLMVRELPVYGSDWLSSDYIGPFAEVLKPSKGVPLSKKPHTVKEADGPKYLYILRLEGDYSAYLGRPASELTDHHIIKVGFSRSPTTRCKQIQSAYPRGSFIWHIVKQYPESGSEALPNAEVAMAGENAMKKRLAEEGGECLGGEFYLAEDNLFERTMSVGRFFADAKQDELGLHRIAPDR